MRRGFGAPGRPGAAPARLPGRRGLLAALGALALLAAAARAEDPPDPLDGFVRAPDPAEAPGPDADLFGEAVALQGEGRYRRARRLFWRLLDEHPDSPYAPEAEDRSGPNAFLGCRLMHEPRPSERRIDVALMGDGYLFDRQDRFDRDAAGHLEVLLREPVYGAYEPYFNFWRFNLASRETGVDEVERLPPDEEEEERRRRRPPRRLKEYDTALDCKAAGPQGQVMADPRRVLHYLSYLDVNDALAICFAKKGALGMAGMGIATSGPKGVVVHEFGHAFAGLIDEYAVNPGPPHGAVEGANATTHPEDPPWRHFLEAGVPGVGVFEGGGTFRTGVWRPAPSCAMNTGGSRYCPVCREAVVLAIYSYVSPIDEARPSEDVVSPGSDGWPRFQVVPMRPATHALEVAWYLGPAPEPAPEPPPDPPVDEGPMTPFERRLRERLGVDRRSPSSLPEHIPPRGRWRAEGSGREDPPSGERLEGRRRRERDRVVHEPVLPALPPGRHLLTAVVRDPARPRGARRPWVLKDERGLLEDRRAWVLLVPADPPGGAAR